MDAFHLRAPFWDGSSASSTKCWENHRVNMSQLYSKISQLFGSCCVCHPNPLGILLDISFISFVSGCFDLCKAARSMTVDGIFMTLSRTAGSGEPCGTDAIHTRHISSHTLLRGAAHAACHVFFLCLSVSAILLSDINHGSWLEIIQQIQQTSVRNNIECACVHVFLGHHTTYIFPQASNACVLD